MHTSDDVTFQMAPGKPMHPAEVDSMDLAVEVIVLWGESSILHVEHLSPPRAFHVGERADFLIGAESLGVDRLPVCVDAGERVAVVLPQGATGEVTTGEGRVGFDELASRGELRPSATLAGAQEYVLPQGASARVRYRGFAFVVTPMAAARKLGVGAASELGWRRFAWGAASLIAHGALLSLFYFTPPRSSALAMDRSDRESALVRYVIEARETRVEQTPDWAGPAETKAPEGAEGKAHDGSEGRMGKKEAPVTHKRFAIEGPRDNEQRHMSREQLRQLANQAGIIGVIQGDVAAWNTPTSPYGREQAIGSDPMSALAALMGDEIGESGGDGGLGMTHVGRGGGGDGKGTIGTGPLLTIGHTGRGKDGPGSGSHTGGLGSRGPRVPPKIRVGKADIRGSLSKEVIRRVIHEHLNEVRHCYTQALISQPDLGGRVAVKFIISPSGAVQMAIVAESQLGNGGVETCIAGAVRRWTFPAPEGGGVVVVGYPFMLEQAGN